MMVSELEDLLVRNYFRNYSAEKIDGKIVVGVNRKGNYRAKCGGDVLNKLTIGKSDNKVFVRTGKNAHWAEMK